MVEQAEKFEGTVDEDAAETINDDVIETMNEDAAAETNESTQPGSWLARMCVLGVIL